MHMYSPVLLCTIGCSYLLSRGRAERGVHQLLLAAAVLLLLLLATAAERPGQYSIQRVLINFSCEIWLMPTKRERGRGVDSHKRHAASTPVGRT